MSARDTDGAVRGREAPRRAAAPTPGARPALPDAAPERVTLRTRAAAGCRGWPHPRVLSRGGVASTVAATLPITRIAFSHTTGPTVLELSVAPGFNTGDHVHSTTEEIFYVVEGRAQIRVDERLLQAQPGDFVLVPLGVAHGFGSLEGGTAKILLIISPAGVHEGYFNELAAILAKPGAPDVQAISDLRARYDTTQVSPLSA